jgi:hypothetical protein
LSSSTPVERLDGTGVAELLHTAALNIIGGAISATIKTFPFR